MLNKDNGTPYLLLNDFFEYTVGIIWFRVCPISSFNVVFPAEPVIVIIGVPNDFLIEEDSFVNVFSDFFTIILFVFFFV